MGLESILYGFKRFNRNLIASSLLGLSLLTGCSDSGGDSSTRPSTPTEPTVPTQPPKQNQNPIILSVCPTTVDENQNYECVVQAMDPDGDVLYYRKIQGPTWLDFTSNILMGKASDVLQNQSSSVEFEVYDGKGGAPRQSYTLTVKNIKNTYVLSSTQLTSLSNVSSNSLVFSQPVNFVAGDIIGAGISAKTLEGLLREVTSVSADKKKVYTQQATLEQTIYKASLRFSKSLYPSDIQSSEFIDGASSRTSSWTASGTSGRTSGGTSMSPQKALGFSFSINLNDVVLYDRDGNQNTKSDQVTANGSFSFSTDFSLDIDIEPFSIKYLSFQNVSSEKADISISSNSLGVAQYKEIKIAEYNFQPFVIGYLPTPVPFPVVVRPKLSFSVTLSPTFVNPLSIRVTQDASSEIGMTYSGRWEGSKKFSNNFSFSNPVFSGEWDMIATVGPRLDLFVYGALGPVALAGAGLRLTGTKEDYSLYGKLDASIGVSMEIFSKKILSHFEKVIEYERLLIRNERPGTPGDSFTDTRDGRVYKMVKIGNQTWMAENLGFNHANSRFYGNSSSAGTTYGRLYGKFGAEESCPSGWKLPSSSDWDVLFTSLGGKNVPGTGGKMKATGTIEAGNGLWRSPNSGATNESGFAALPGGMSETNASTTFSNLGYKGYFWVSTSSGAYANFLNHDSGMAGSSLTYGSNQQNVPMFSVRCWRSP